MPKRWIGWAVACAALAALAIAYLTDTKERRGRAVPVADSVRETGDARDVEGPRRAQEGAPPETF